MKRILLVPDAYIENFSGAYVARIAKQLLLELGNTVAVFAEDIKADSYEEDGTKLYHRLHYKLMANWLESAYIDNFNKVLDNFRPDVVFTLGSVTNKNICYFTIAKNRGIKVISKIFMQDFFCAKYYANDASGLCTKCLDESYLSAMKVGCRRTNSGKIQNFMRGINNALIRYRMQKVLVEIDYVITSTHQQVGFYMKYGFSKKQCVVTPLYFNGEKLDKYRTESKKGNYYVFVAQNRIDKGVHILSSILQHCKQNVVVIAAYSNEEVAQQAITKYGWQPFLDSGVLEIRSNCSWGTDLGTLIAKCRGVINPSIWPTTTEYVLLETLGLKKPIFTLNVGIHKEKIINGVNGFIAITPEEMAEQMNDFANNDDRYDEISENAYSLYKELTDWAGWKNTLQQIID